MNGSQYVRPPITFPSATSMSLSRHSQTTIEVAIGVITGSGATPSYRTTARHSGEYRDVSGASTADGADIQQYTCGCGTNQQWTRTSS
ncbi:RICIN domain-containing protein [Nonomuraea sp. NPDC049625]|uniref:RICIN domain-containing protein n=1 Tax=Nonomuraea sp. NPDC049625 TaxID=3155775 RepID=UPI00342E7233